MRLSKVVSALAAVCITLSAIPMSVSSLSAVPTISGETSRTRKEITLSNGTKTGVMYTNIKLSGTYGNNRELNIADADLSNTNLSLEVINHGTYMTSSRTLTNGVNEYNSANPGKQILAAVNGDLWMTAYHNHSGVMKTGLSVPRGAMFIDGEVWSTQQTDQENIEATNAEKGHPTGYKYAFGVTKDNQPLLGSPQIQLELRIGARTVYADGVNRLPATNSIMVYNHRIASSNYALDDAYEVVVTIDKAANIPVEGSISGSITAIYEPNSATRPSLTEKNTIVLTARGTRIADIKKYCTVGKKVTLNTTITDALGKTDMWKNVDDAMGGHMTVFDDGVGTDYTDTTAYPAALVGYKDDGTVSLMTCTSTLDKSRAALKFSQAYELCRELGFNGVFYLDGGGSATFVSLENGKYTVRNKCSDGSQRSVISSIALVWNDTPHIKRQGHLNYIEKPLDKSGITPVYFDGDMLMDSVKNPNCVGLSYDKEANALEMKVSSATNDPYATLDFSGYKKLEAANYPYLVFKVKTSKTVNTLFGLYYACGSDMGAGGDRTTNVTVIPSGAWQYITFNMAGLTGWSGNINNIRLDMFNGGNHVAGEAMLIGEVFLCRSELQARRVVNDGFIPNGACTNYSEQKEALKPTPYFINGDAAVDGKINVADLFKVKQMLVGLVDTTPTEQWAADTDGNKTVNLKDCFELKYYVSKGVWPIS